MPKEARLNGADYLLLLLFLNNKAAILGSVRLMKMMFLFNEEIAPALKNKGESIPHDVLPVFEAYNYGPFSKNVYDQVELFQNIGFIRVDNLRNNEEMCEADDWEEPAFIDELESQDDFLKNRDGKFIKYEILSLGESYVQKKIIPMLSKEVIDLLEHFKARITQTSIKSILQYVYTKYPDMTEKSLIRDEVLNS